MLLWNIDGLDLKDVQDRHWRDVQYWARGNTDRRDVFIVPPDLSGFRVESERASYGDWKDGTQMFFDPAFRREWIRRMRKLGYDGDARRLGANYAALPPERFIEIAAEFEGEGRRIYAVVPHGSPDGAPVDTASFDALDRFPVAFGNEAYVVRAIAP
ncbi:MAG: hypothetical protein Q8R92_15290 [Deltaproteobacteria bacterium]|nr:hypothetical protein [Deltaproteobacteria bacterium]